ncbi:uncharacterized protein DUF2612 [Paraburkholderia caballeronis]|uniref:DUF2612 domain-containing protein n=1 Tax=Paraburkholderia caballeronis TaxID=416943 RepID=UPI00106617A2|nr:DUF2612 domain-containing protein [Paraburkholderia caballeronis]TDV39517.1 uncharacterized protein DUF2612 [Paraburkholderia caballeronis]
MAEITDYTGLITSEHQQAPKFMATVAALVGPLVDQINVLGGMPSKFDLDEAVGDQLDVVGEWIGLGRGVKTPLTGVYFALDTPGLGFDQGVWMGPFDPSTGVTELDDETYRLMIRAKIAANHWDGTFESSVSILQSIFPGGASIFIEDNLDMSIGICVAGVVPSALFLALLSGGYIPIKPAGVRVSYYLVTSETGAPIFGFDMDNTFVAGFDSGAWATQL